MPELAAAMLSQIFSLPQINPRLSAPFRPVADNRRQIANQRNRGTRITPQQATNRDKPAEGVISVEAARGCGVNI